MNLVLLEGEKIYISDSRVVFETGVEFSVENMVEFFKTMYVYINIKKIYYGY